MVEAGSIKRLSEEVVNRIAAGEVIQRPANAVKEMLENSLDANSTSIVITLKEGGLKFLQIQDNGSGIKKCDMDIVCERFTTSKLSSFEDLTSINTYGFRGEALASITHVSHLTIMSKTHDSLCAYKCSYRDSRMIGGLKSCAGNNGTQITAEDLFYNVPMRRHALKSGLDEHRKVVDVVTRYSVHNPSAEFIVRKQNDTNPDVKTQARSCRTDNIRLLYGSSIAKELLELRGEDRRLGFKLEGLITNANYSSKKHAFILFINNRLVDSNDLRRVVEASYTAYLPKGAYPFVYLSLEIDANNVDINVHPTKSEVHFLNEAEVIDVVQKKVDACLLACNHSRTYFTQTLLPVDIKGDKSLTEDSKSQKGVIRENCMVRTDSKARKIDSFLVKMDGDNNDGSYIDDGGNIDGNDGEGSNGVACNDGGSFSNYNSYGNNEDKVTNNNAFGKDDGEGLEGVKRTLFEGDGGDNTNTSFSNNDYIECTSLKITDLKEPGNDGNSIAKKFKNTNLKSSLPQTSSSSTSLVSKRRKISLTSISSLKKAIESELSIGLKEMIWDSSWVGVVDSRWSLIQHSTKLYLANTHQLLQEYFYQLFIWDFGNFGVMRLSEPASLQELVMLGLQHPDSGWKESDGPKEQLASFVVDLFKSKAAMLWDYFSMQIDQQGNLLSLPLIIDNFIPPLHQLPHLLIRISTEVDWEAEKACFRSLCREFSCFYSTPVSVHEDQVVPGTNKETSEEDKDLKNKLKNGNDKVIDHFKNDIKNDEEKDKLSKDYDHLPNENEGFKSNKDHLQTTFKETNNNKDQKNEDNENNDDNDHQKTEWSSFKWRLEHLLFPSMKRHLLPSKNLSHCLLQVANLPDLYKVFERC